MAVVQQPVQNGIRQGGVASVVRQMAQLLMEVQPEHLSILPAANKEHMAVVPRLFANNQYLLAKSQVFRGALGMLTLCCMWVAS